MEGQNLKQLESNREHLRNHLAQRPPFRFLCFAISITGQSPSWERWNALWKILISSVGVPLLRWGHGRVDHHDASPLHRSVDLAHPNFVISAMKQEGGGLSCPAESQLAVLAKHHGDEMFCWKKSFCVLVSYFSLLALSIARNQELGRPRNAVRFNCNGNL